MKFSTVMAILLTGIALHSQTVIVDDFTIPSAGYAASSNLTPVMVSRDGLNPANVIGGTRTLLASGIGGLTGEASFDPDQPEGKRLELVSGATQVEVHWGLTVDPFTTYGSALNLNLNSYNFELLLGGGEISRPETNVWLILVNSNQGQVDVIKSFSQSPADGDSITWTNSELLAVAGADFLSDIDSIRIRLLSPGATDTEALFLSSAELTPIPEPAAFVLWSGVVAIAGLVQRLRRSSRP